MKVDLDRLAFASFVLSAFVLVAFAAFVYGIVVWKGRIPPYAYVNRMMHALAAVRSRPHHLLPLRYAESGVSIHAPDSVAPGITLITSYWPESGWKPGVRIIDHAGNSLHQWDVDPSALWPNSPYSDSMAGSKNIPSNYVHGTYLFANGDLLLNIEYLGLLRLDACGRVLWSLPYRTHHSVSRDEDGNFWVAGLRWVDPGTERAAAFPDLKPPFGEDMAVKVSPDGRILTEISMLRALFDNGYKRLFWKYQRRTGDVTHLNDVEPLNSTTAAAFPEFAAGDILVSLREIHTVAVLDRQGRVKWLTSDPFVHQHDPDFEADGRIVVFDNRRDGSVTGTRLGGSAITAIDPSTGAVSTIYPAAANRHFYTATGGKHQRLGNGNRLITEAGAGRVFEIDPDGRTVWEWIQQPFDAESVPEVLEGTRYPLQPEEVSAWPCS